MTALENILTPGIRQAVQKKETLKIIKSEIFFTPIGRNEVYVQYEDCNVELLGIYDSNKIEYDFVESDFIGLNKAEGMFLLSKKDKYDFPKTTWRKIWGLL